MAFVEGCKHTLEITVPLAEVNQETERAVAELQKKARLPGFRPGKVPPSLLRSRFAHEIRQEALENLVPKFFRKKVEEENLQIVGRPDIRDVHFHEGEPLTFKADFEVAPVVELSDYAGLVVNYREPEVADEDVAKRLEEIREQKAEYVNIDPRPLAEGDYAAISLRSVAGAEKPVEQDELTIHLGDPETLPAFSENLAGLEPGAEKEFDVVYPDDFGKHELAGKTVRFSVQVKAVRRKELPELNDEFAKDLGDYQTLEELREAVRKGIFQEREYHAQQEAKNQLVEKLVDLHEFPVPEAYVERQVEVHIEQHLRELAAQGIDPRSVKVDWEKVKAGQRDKAVREVKASLLLDKIADRETIETTNDELDREVQRIAKQQREPVAAMRMKLDKDGTLRRIVGQIRTEKTLNFLFEHARKEAAEN